MQLHYKVHPKEIVDGMCYEELGLKDKERSIHITFPAMTVVVVKATKEMQRRFEAAFKHMVAYKELCQMRQTAIRRAQALEAWNAARDALIGP